MEYSYIDHAHSFAVWSACLASSQKGCRFTVEIGQKWFESVPDLKSLICEYGDAPPVEIFDQTHRGWRKSIIEIAAPLKITHGVAAKLINVYLKSAVVLPRIAMGRSVNQFHPPIDRVLLKNLRKERPEIWDGPLQAWTNFSSDDYEEVIRKIRSMLLPDQPLWEIEKFWPGYQ